MVLSMERWKGKVAIVTGASSGIGAAIVDQLVKHGLKVVGVARRANLIEEKARNVNKDSEGSLHAFQADVSLEEDILKTFKWATESIGPVHVLVNNAGIHLEGELTSSETENWRKVLDVNVLGLSIATREAIKSMKSHDIKGHIFHMNSVAGHGVPPFPNINIYAASKYAITALTETLRQELVRNGSKIRVTSISPGLVETEMTTLNLKYGPELTNFLKTLPIIKAEDVADAVVYALSTPEHVQVSEITIKPVGEPH